MLKRSLRNFSTFFWYVFFLILLKIRVFIDFEDDWVNWSLILGKDKSVIKSWKEKISPKKKKELEI